MMTPRILIIDADRNAAHVTGALVERLVPGATVTYAATPGAGWLAAQCIVPDVLLIDPDAQRPASMLVIQLCKAAWPDIRVLVLASAPRLHRQVAQLGVDVYVEKPIAAAHLVAQLRAGLSTCVPQASL